MKTETFSSHGQGLLFVTSITERMQTARSRRWLRFITYKRIIKNEYVDFEHCRVVPYTFKSAFSALGYSRFYFMKTKNKITINSSNARFKQILRASVWFVWRFQWNASV